MPGLLDEIEPLKQAAVAELKAAPDLAALEQTKGAWLGANGKFTALMKRLGTLSKEEKPIAGKAVNAAKVELEAALVGRREELELKAALPKEPTDFTLPGRRRVLGKLHPLTQVTEDIVRSFTEDYFGRLDALIAWGREQPPGAQTARELLDRYITIVMESGEVFRFLERNQATIHGTEDGKHRFTQFRPRLAALMEVITGPGASARSRIRSAAAIFAVSTSCMFFMKDMPDADMDAVLPAPPTREELRAIVLEFATDLTSDDLTSDVARLAARVARFLAT